MTSPIIVTDNSKTRKDQYSVSGFVWNKMNEQEQMELICNDMSCNNTVTGFTSVGALEKLEDYVNEMQNKYDPS